MNGIEAIAKERKEQIEKHGHTVAQDVELNAEGQLMHAALQLGYEHMDHLTPYVPPVGWNPEAWKKMCEKPYEDRIVIAGALLAAEYDRRKMLAAQTK